MAVVIGYIKPLPRDLQSSKVNAVTGHMTVPRSVNTALNVLFMQRFVPRMPILQMIR